MKRYILAPEATQDLVEIWGYITKQSGAEMADRVESVIRDKNRVPVRQPWCGTLAQRSNSRKSEVLLSLFISDRLSARDEAAANRLYSPQASRRRKDFAKIEREK